MLNKLFRLLLLLLMMACGKPLPDLTPMDLQLWKDDKSGCRLKRIMMMEELEKQKEELRGLAEKDIIQLLGRPDRNELYKRNQKFYYYDIEPGESCADQESNGKKLVIRFTAMGYAKEVSIE